MLDPTSESNKNLKAPIISFAVSIALTLVVYYFAVVNFLDIKQLMFTLIGLGVVQTIVQLVFFFQIADEQKPRWNLMTLLFTVMVIIIIVGGSMWIMSNIDYNLMPKMSS
ncbi:MAG: Cytochrome bo(3) ubiquinol oxidase subunit 4 [Chlamydiae bacterium]|nr:Cytochrome bo(3) ubiquinol oxidase subunit 4 [Chlamydiota bacterium]